MDCGTVRPISWRTVNLQFYPLQNRWDSKLISFENKCHNFFNETLLKPIRGWEAKYQVPKKKKWKIFLEKFHFVYKINLRCLLCAQFVFGWWIAYIGLKKLMTFETICVPLHPGSNALSDHHRIVENRIHKIRKDHLYKLTVWTTQLPTWITFYSFTF